MQAARRVSSALVIRTAGRLLTLAVAVVFARVLGVHDFGTYALAIGVASVLTIPASLGMDRYLVRVVAAPSVTGSRKSVADVKVEANRLSGVAALVVVGTAGAAMVVCDVEVTLVMGVAVLSIVPFRAALLVRQAILQGLGEVTRSLIPLFVLIPGIQLVIIGLSVVGGLTIRSTSAVVVTSLATLGAMIAAEGWVRRSNQQPSHNHGEPEQMEVSARQAAPFAVASGSSTASMFVGVIMLGLLAGDDLAGQYQAALRISEGLTLIAAAINVPLAPTLVRMNTASRKAELQRVVTAASVSIALLTCAAAAVLVMFNEHILGVFGAQFVEASSALKILIAAQIASALCGSVALIVMMIGRSQMVAWTLLSSVGIDIVLCTVLIPVMGIEGAAIARASGLVWWNIVLLGWVVRKVKVNPSCIVRPNALVSSWRSESG